MIKNQKKAAAAVDSKWPRRLVLLAVLLEAKLTPLRKAENQADQENPSHNRTDTEAPKNQCMEGTYLFIRWLKIQK